MLLGAVFEREIRFAPRSRGLFVARSVYCAALLAIVATCWLVVTGTQSITTPGDTARFGATLLRILAPLQLSLAMLAAALTGAVAVSSEKDRRTLELLLVSRLSDRELVLGKLAASLVRVLLLLVSAVPIFAIAGLFGGVTPGQLARLFAVTAAAALAAASIATAVAFWKETTFQALAITMFALVAWVAAGELAAAWRGAEAGAMASPARAAFAALSPAGQPLLLPFLGVCAAIIVAANLIAVTQVRHWNVAGEARPRSPAQAPPRASPGMSGKTRSSGGRSARGRMAARSCSCVWPGCCSLPPPWQASCRRPGGIDPTGSPSRSRSCRWRWRASWPWRRWPSPA